MPENRAADRVTPLSHERCISGWVGSHDLPNRMRRLGFTRLFRSARFASMVALVGLVVFAVARVLPNVVTDGQRFTRAG